MYDWKFKKDLKKSVKISKKSTKINQNHRLCFKIVSFKKSEKISKNLKKKSTKIMDGALKLSVLYSRMIPDIKVASNLHQTLFVNVKRPTVFFSAAHR